MALTEVAVSAVLGELLKALLEIKGKIEEYNSTLNRIEATLTQIEPIVKEIDDLNGKLDQKGKGGETNQLWKEITKGKDLLQCCKKEIGGCCSCLQKQQYQYLGRLQELDKSLSSFYNIVVSLHTLRAVREGHAQNDAHHKIVMGELEEIKKLIGKDNTPNTSNKAPRQENSPARVPESSVTPVPDQRKQVPKEYGRVDSKGKDGGGPSDFVSSFLSKGKECPTCNVSLPTGKIPPPPKDYAPPSPVPHTSGFSQVKSNLEEGRHPDQTKRPTTMTHSVPSPRPSPPPRSPEIVPETKLDAPADILPYQPMDIPWWQANVQPESKQVKQIPDKAKEVPREFSYLYSSDSKNKVSISPVSSNDFTRGASFGKDSPSGRYSSDSAKPVGPATSNYGFGVPPKSPETTDQAYSRPYIPPDPPSSSKDINPKGQATDRSHGFTTYHQPASSAAPPKPQEMKTNFMKDPSGYSSPTEKRSTIPAAATSNYGFGVPPKSPETKPLGPTTAATNQASSRPYITPDPPSSGKDINPKGQATDRSHGFTTYHQPASSAAPPRPQEMKTNFVKDPSGYSSPTEKRNTIPAAATRSNDNPLTRSYIPQSGQPKTTDVDHNQGNMVTDKWRTTKQPISGSSYAPPSNKALPNKVLEIKKGAYEEESSSDENDE